VQNLYAGAINARSLGVSMEAGSSSGEAAKAAPKRSALGVVIAIVIAIAATAAVMDLAVFPAMQSTRPQTDYVKFHITTYDVGYYFTTPMTDFHPELPVKAGQLVLIEMNNSGTMDHEFLLFNESRATILARTNYALTLAESNHSTYATDPAAGDAMVDEYTSYHDTWDNLSRVGCPDSCIDHDVGPGETTLFWFVINTPGTYFFACHQVDRTQWKVHQDLGMWGTVVVSA
jgi:uncharacterized cupredoxin-like copper-binding protein